MNQSSQIIQNLKSTLHNNGIDYESIINELGQVQAAEKRLKVGFTFSEHLECLILAMLSNQRPWKPISDNKCQIKIIFSNYNPDILANVDYNDLETKIKAIKCGNRSINQQMASLKENINQLRKIEKEFSTLDDFVSHAAPEDVAGLLSDSKSKYKIKQLGMALAMEYLKNVGITGMKPDLHMLRICGPQRLDIISSNNVFEQLEEFKRFSNEVDLSQTYLDNLFWIFGAKDYGDICSADPKCEVCELGNYCNYSK